MQKCNSEPKLKGAADPQDGRVQPVGCRKQEFSFLLLYLQPSHFGSHVPLPVTPHETTQSIHRTLTSFTQARVRAGHGSNQRQQNQLNCMTINISLLSSL